MWRDIKTAPKNGKNVLLWDGNRIEIGSYRKDDNERGRKKHWLLNDYDDWSCGFASTPVQPTHWMPLPEPPAA